ncbi:MAG: hypothetical protein RLO14_22565, partial [Marinobacter salarius]
SKATLHNNGSIVGYYGTANGGNGGHAVKTDIPLSVANFGVIYAGGGGGTKGANDSAQAVYAYSSSDDNCHESTKTCSVQGGAGGRGAGWYGTGTYFINAVGGGSGSSCTVGQVHWLCGGSVDTASSGRGANGGSFGTSATPSGGTGGVAFNAYRLISFTHAGLWSGRVIDDASPGEDNSTPTEPVEDAEYLLTVSAHTQDYSIASGLMATGWDGVTPTSVKVVVDQGVVVGGSASTGYAMRFEGLPEGSTAILVNNGDIIGRYGSPNGGSGGHAVKTSIPLKLYNYGRVYSGGGAGVKGANRSATGIYYGGGSENCNSHTQTCTAQGGNGGLGAGWYSLGAIYEQGASGSGGAKCT